MKIGSLWLNRADTGIMCAPLPYPIPKVGMLWHKHSVLEMKLSPRVYSVIEKRLSAYITRYE